MKNTETGEFELVLGNRQLLSGFFVVVILFAVFFVMGYIVGRNSSPPSRATSDVPSNALPTPAETRPQPASGGAPAAQAAQPAATEPAKGSSAENAASEPRATPATEPPREPEPKAEAATAVAITAVEPAAGESYLQVLAVRQEEAEVIARTLKDKGFPSLLSPAPKGLTRVLVGPYTDTATLGKAKAGLENAGFRPIVKR